MTTITKTEQLNALKDRIHAGNSRWWQDLTTGEPIKRDRRELLALVVSEVSEALEGARKNLQDDHIPSMKMEHVECADVAIRLYDFAGGFDIPLERQDYYFEIPDNVGAALFELTKLITLCEAEDWAVSSCLAYIRKYCETRGYDLDLAVETKLEYNKHRADHKIENRLKEGGKLW
jgi:hypothetical protein